MKFEIRQAETSDGKNLASLSIQVWLDTYAQEGVKSSYTDYIFEYFTQKEFENRIENKRYEIFVAVQGKYLLGYIMLDFASFHKTENNGFEIERLYVSRHVKGQGIGKKLLAKMADKCGKTSWLTANVINIDAIEFYKHLGFEDIDEILFILDGEKLENRVLAWK